MEEEVWKDVVGYEGLYQVSSLGRVKSLSRNMRIGETCYKSKDRILKSCNDRYGYPSVALCNTGQKTINIHLIMAMAFLGYIPKQYVLTVDHINNIRNDNRIDNLQILTVRENCSKDQFRRKKSSKYVGVSWNKNKNKWSAFIRTNGKALFLGLFKNEIDAFNAYQNALYKHNVLTKHEL